MIIQSALSGENVLTEKYTTILNFISDLRPFHEEIMKFLGREQEQQYLIILQNSAEKRPNG